MPALPGVPRTWIAGEYPPASVFNTEIKDSLNFLANPPAVRLTHSVAQSIAHQATGLLAFNTERHKTAGYAGMHDNVTTNSRITIVTGGLYVVTAHITFDSNVTGARALTLRRAGTTGIAEQVQPAEASGWFHQGMSIATVWRFAAGEYVEVVVVQDSGVALNVQKIGDHSPEFTATWVGK